MPIRNIASIAVAILLGLIAVILVRNYLAATPQARAPGGAVLATTPVVVAAQPLARGVALQPSLLKVVNYPQSDVPASSFRSVAELTGEKDGARLTLRSIVADEPILTGSVSEPGGKLNLSTVLDDGMRAISVRSNDVAGVGGFVLPGDRVDVLLTRAVGAGDRAHSVTQVLAENALVLGVDQSDNAEEHKPVVAKAVTVEVTPDQAQAISLGQSVGTITLALRHVSDDASLVNRMTTEADLGREARPRRGIRGAHGDQVHVYRGTAFSTYALSQVQTHSKLQPTQDRGAP
ncbi:MAG TPA: Flp pilus assembly protein CpaB [Rhizomicrobium sp.]|nr:Flp pilus assembly protein CpaB [Rhizomicrobium sp.]